MTREEAIEKVRQMSLPKETMEILEALAPELRESEDERIRKELVQFLTDVKNISEGGRDSWHVRKEDAGMCDSFLAYLEKKKEQKPAEWSEEDEKNLDYCLRVLNGFAYEEADNAKDWLKSLRPQSKDEIYKEKDEAFKLGKHQLAIKFMNYLDENRSEGKMSLSNGECEDIDKAFNENDWAKIMRYVEKYLPHWKPSKMQMNYLSAAVMEARRKHNESVNGYPQYAGLKSLYENLEKLM